MYKSSWAPQAGTIVPVSDAQLLQLDTDASAVTTGQNLGEHRRTISLFGMRDFQAAVDCHLWCSWHSS